MGFGVSAAAITGSARRRCSVPNRMFELRPEQRRIMEAARDPMPVPAEGGTLLASSLARAGDCSATGAARFSAPAHCRIQVNEAGLLWHGPCTSMSWQLSASPCTARS